MADQSLLLGQLAEEFTRLVRQGKLPEIEEYAQRYPELADRIRELFPTLLFLEGMTSFGAQPRQDVPSAIAAGSCFGRYGIDREIGRGGMGIVYEAVHLLLEKRVALKVKPMHTAADAAQLERFSREARTAAGRHLSPRPAIASDAEQEYSQSNCLFSDLFAVMEEERYRAGSLPTHIARIFP